MALNKTRAELIEQVLRNLGKLANGAPEAEDSERVDVVIDPTVALLSAQEIYTVGDVGEEGPSDGAIEPEAFLDLANIVAMEAAPAFNMAQDKTIIGLAQLAEKRLRIIGSGRPSYFPLKATYY